MEKEENRVDEISEKLIQVNRELKNMVLFLESEKSARYLCFQNI